MSKPCGPHSGNDTEPRGAFELVNQGSGEGKDLEKSTSFYYEAGSVKLVPVPSRDPNDPLRLPPWRKNLVLITLSVYNAGCMTAATSIGGIIPALSKYYMQDGPISRQEMSELGTFPMFMMGLGCIFFVFVGQTIGARPALIMSAGLSFGGSVWAAASVGPRHGLYSHIAARCFLGFAAGGAESLGPFILQGLHYVHVRNTHIATSFAGGGAVAAILGSTATYIVDGTGWRWFYGLLAAICLLGLVLVVAVVPETTWPRNLQDLNGTSETDENGFCDPRTSSRREESYMYSLRVWPENVNVTAAWQGVKDQLRCWTFPNIVWVILLNAAFAGSTVSAGLVLGNALQDYYGWAPRNISLMNISMAIGNIVTIPLAGVVSDWAVKVMTKRNGGKRVAEHQLVNLIIPLITGFIGTLCFGVFLQTPQKYTWPAVITMLGFQYGSLCINVISTTYAIECYPDLAAAMTIAIGAYRNIVGFCITYGAQSFVNNTGFAATFGTFAAIAGFFGLCGIPFYLWGQRIRQAVNTWSFRYPSSTMHA